MLEFEKRLQFLAFVFLWYINCSLLLFFLFNTSLGLNNPASLWAVTLLTVVGKIPKQTRIGLQFSQNWTFSSLAAFRLHFRGCHWDLFWSPYRDLSNDTTLVSLCWVWMPQSHDILYVQFPSLGPSTAQTMSHRGGCICTFWFSFQLWTIWCMTPAHSHKLISQPLVFGNNKSSRLHKIFKAHYLVTVKTFHLWTLLVTSHKPVPLRKNT